MTGDWAHFDIISHRERLVSRNAGFIRQRDEPHGPLPNKSGVPWCPDATRVTAWTLPHPLVNQRLKASSGHLNKPRRRLSNL